jgi:hypothetical protein
MRSIIDRELAAFQQASELDREIEAHREFGRQRAEHFIGRQEVLGKIQAYLTGESSCPFAIQGLSGSGKTALMARVAELMTEGRSPGVERRVISRFIGATPGSRIPSPISKPIPPDVAVEPCALYMRV